MDDGDVLSDTSFIFGVLVLLSSPLLASSGLFRFRGALLVVVVVVVDAVDRLVELVGVPRSTEEPHHHPLGRRTPNSMPVLDEGKTPVQVWSGRWPGLNRMLADWTDRV